MIGFSFDHKSMYFADKSGGKIASKDGSRMIMMDPDFELPNDIESPFSLPGLSKNQLTEVVIPGGYTADFYGIYYKVCLNVNKMCQKMKKKIVGSQNCFLGKVL